MMGIIGHHIITNVISVDFVNPYYTFIDTIFHVSVVVFVLITGIYGIKPRISKLLSLELEIIYYSIISAGVAYFAIKSIGLKELILSLFPISRRVYWFMSAYVELYLASPFINFIIDRSSKRLFIYMIIVLGFSFCVLFNGDTFNAGTNLTGFAFLYCLGRFMSKYHLIDKLSNRSLFLFILVYLLVAFFLSFSSKDGRIFGHFINVFYRYNGIGIIAFGIAIVSLFHHFVFYNDAINRISKSVLAIYLIHENHLIANFVYVKPTQYLLSATQLHSFWVLVIEILCITVLCVLIDQLRILSFQRINFQYLETYIKRSLNL
jgi:surface polysaccharide O-acyltransferase-like enzyme